VTRESPESAAQPEKAVQSDRKARQPHSLENRATATVLAAITDSVEAAAATGIPERTIRTWHADAQSVASTGDLAAYVAAKKLAAAVAVASELEKFAIEVVQCAREATEPKQAQVAREKAVVFGIMTDKLGVLVNGSLPGRFGSGGGASLILGDDEVVERAITRAQTQK